MNAVYRSLRCVATHTHQSLMCVMILLTTLHYIYLFLFSLSSAHKQISPLRSIHKSTFISSSSYEIIRQISTRILLSRCVLRSCSIGYVRWPSHPGCRSCNCIFRSMSSSSPPSSSSSLVGSMSAGSKKFRHAILKNLLLGLRKGGAASSSSRGMSLHERRDAVRHAADAALADARGAAPRWSRALAAELSSSQHGHRRPTTSRTDDDVHHLVDVPTASIARPSGQCKSSSPCKKEMISRRRRLRARPKSRATARAAGAVARVLARRRARALREMVPGGRGILDECTLLGETLDYAVSLKAQVDAMQLLLRTLQQHPKNKPLLKQQQ